MKVALELELAKRMRTATRWVEGQQGRLPGDDTDTADGFGRMMLVRTGALPANYAGTMGVPGTIIDQQSGTNTAGVAVLIKDINGGLLSANTNYSGRLGGYLDGKALYVVTGAASVGTGIRHGKLSGAGTITGDDGLTYRYGTYGAWYESQSGLQCKFIDWRSELTWVESKVVFCLANYNSNIRAYELTTVYSQTRFAMAIDPMRLAAHFTWTRSASIEPTSGGPRFRAAVSFSFNEPYGSIVSASAGSWPTVGYDPIQLVGYSPFWDGNKTNGTIGAPLGGF